MEVDHIRPLLKKYNIEDLAEKIQDYVEMDNYSYYNYICKNNEKNDKAYYHAMTLKKICIDKLEITFGYPLNIYIKPYKINSNTYIEPSDQFFYNTINTILYKIMLKRGYTDELTRHIFHKKGNKYKLVITIDKMSWFIDLYNYNPDSIYNLKNYAHRISIELLKIT